MNNINNFLNKVYCMDNLELLKQIPDESINIIYNDILYNTGKKFKDYDDNLGTPQEAIEWYRPRLIEMKRILKDTGNILLQMDYRLVHYMKVEMDNIFGMGNFFNEIIWSKGNEQNNAKNNLAFRWDCILCYRLNKNNTFNMQYVKFNPKNANRYNKEDENGKYALVLDKKANKYYKCYLKDEIPLNNIWSDIPSSKSRRYDTEKPSLLLERLIKLFSNEGDVVADFFCGSGTSLVVAKELNRQFIGCDINPRAVEITENRLNK